MLKPIKYIGVFALLLAVGLFTSGCNNLKYTFGGTIPSQSGTEGDKANFGGIVDACNCKDMEWGILDDHCTPMGNILYHDDKSTIKPPLHIKAKPVKVFDCSGDHIPWRFRADECDVCDYLADNVCTDDVQFMFAAKIIYKSQNPKVKNGKYINKQTGIICLTDNGEGANADQPDFAAIKLTYGPYVGYKNCGPVSGNVQEHECDEYLDETF